MWHAALRARPIHQEQTGSLTPVALCHFFIVLQPNATHTLTDSHTGQTKNVYNITKADFPTSPHRTMANAQKLPSAKRKSGENPLAKALMAVGLKTEFYVMDIQRAIDKKKNYLFSFLKKLI